MEEEPVLKTGKWLPFYLRGVVLYLITTMVEKNTNWCEQIALWNCALLFCNAIRDFNNYTVIPGYVV